jgi:hypothetical protein
LVPDGARAGNGSEPRLSAPHLAGIGFRGEDAARRPWVIGSGLDVWEIVRMLEDFGSIESLVAQTQLSERHARLAVVYRDGYPEEIAEAIAENRRTAESGANSTASSPRSLPASIARIGADIGLSSIRTTPGLEYARSCVSAV